MKIPVMVYKSTYSYSGLHEKTELLPAILIHSSPPTDGMNNALVIWQATGELEWVRLTDIRAAQSWLEQGSLPDKGNPGE